MKSEIEPINEKGTWILVPRPKDRQVITSKLLLRRKLNPDRSSHCHKARLVARGFNQVASIDFHEIFSPTLIITSLRTTIGLAAQLNLYIHQIDIKKVFLNGDLDQPIYMEQPKYFKDIKNPDYVCLLKKTLYGLKQSPRFWYYMLHQFLIKKGYKRLKSDKKFYTRHNGTHILILVVYVDDILIISNRVDHIKTAKEKLATTFSITDGGPLHYMLGIEFNLHGPDNNIQLCQRKFAEDILNKYQMMDLKPSPIPAAPHLSLSSDMAPKDPQEIKEMETQPFREMLGSLRYLVSCTRPDLCYITGLLIKIYAESR